MAGEALTANFSYTSFHHSFQFYAISLDEYIKILAMMGLMFAITQHLSDS
jgi:hypothetical protein